MIEVKKEGVLLNKTELGFENEGVLNPAVIKVDDIIHLFYRAVLGVFLIPLQILVGCVFFRLRSQEQK